MIPKNIELPDDVLSRISSDPILLRWLSSVQSQLVTSTAELNGIGCTRIIWNDTGSAIAGNEEVNVDDGLTLSYFNSSGVLVRSTAIFSGVWFSSSGTIPAGEAREMTRIA